MEPENFQVMFRRLEAEVQKVIVGNSDVIRKVLIAFFAGGHVLLEGVPGLGKTLLVKSLSQALGMSFKRIQFTPDLMPSDIVVTELLTESNGRGDFAADHRGGDQRDFESFAGRQRKNDRCYDAAVAPGSDRPAH